MNEEQIIDLLKSPSFGIRNGIYHSKINRLAKGNARLAIMLATLANQEKCDITILSDVSAVYDEYYQRVMPDQTVWTDVTRLRVLGLLAVLRVVDTTDSAEIEPILSFLEISDVELWRQIHHLERLEIVEVYQDNAFRFTEQVFATYSIYQCFYKRRALDLVELLVTFNDSVGYRVKDAILSVYESYDKVSIRDWVQPILFKHYATLQNNRLKLTFLSMYTRFLLNEVPIFINDFVEGRVTSDSINRYGMSIEKEIVGLLFEYLAHTNKKNNAFIGYKLIFDLFAKQFVTLEDIKEKVKVYLTRSHSYYFNEFDGPRYEQYDWLSTYLVERGLQGSEPHCQVMDSSLKLFLLLMYDKPNSPPIYRRRVWDYADNRLSSKIKTVKKAIYDYMGAGYGNIDNDCIQADIEEMVGLFRRQFSRENPLDCRNVQRYVIKLDELSLNRNTYRTLASEFNGELYQIYCTLCFDKLRGHNQPVIDFLESSELRKRKIEEMRDTLVCESLDDFELLYGKIRGMWSLVVQQGDGWNISQGLTEYFLSIAEQDSGLFTNIFRHALTTGLPDGYTDHPPLLTTIMQRSYVGPEDLYATLLPMNEKSAPWLFNFFWSLSESEINLHWFARLDSHLADFATYLPNRIIIPEFLKRYISFDASLPKRIFNLLSSETLLKKERWSLGSLDLLQ